MFCPESRSNRSSRSDQDYSKIFTRSAQAASMNASHTLSRQLAIPASRLEHADTDISFASTDDCENPVKRLSAVESLH